MINQDMNSRDGFVYDARLYYGMSFLYPHLHRSAEIIHVIKGEILVDINAVRTHVPAGKCVLILPYRLHSFECAPDALFMVHVFSHDCAPEFFRLLGSRTSQSPVFDAPEENIAYYLKKFGVDKINHSEHSFEMLPLAHTDQFVEFHPKVVTHNPVLPQDVRLNLITALESVLAGFLAKPDLAEGGGGSLIERVLSYIGAHSDEEPDARDGSGGARLRAALSLPEDEAVHRHRLPHAGEFFPGRAREGAPLRYLDADNGNRGNLRVRIAPDFQPGVQTVYEDYAE